MALAAARLELMNIHYVDKDSELLDELTNSIMKYFAFTGERHDILKAPDKTFEATGQHCDSDCSAQHIEVKHIKATKGYAVEAYAQTRGNSMDEDLTIGDNRLDECMIKMAQYGVAMGNAIPENSALAWDTTQTHSENGVAADIRQEFRVKQAEAYNAHLVSLRLNTACDLSWEV